MANFKDFLLENSSNALVSLRAHKKEVAENSTEILLASVCDDEKVSRKEARKFSSELSDLVHSDDFMTELSTKLPSPKIANSKSEYVNDAKSEMKALLMKRLAK